MRSLDPEAFSNDEEVRVHGAGREVWLSERLFRRLALIGGAYERHLLPLLAQDVTLNSTQCDGLLGELDFVGELVADEALTSMLNALAPVVSACRASGQDLLVEWP